MLVGSLVEARTAQDTRGLGAFPNCFLVELHPHNNSQTSSGLKTIRLSNKKPVSFNFNTLETPKVGFFLFLNF